MRISGYEFENQPSLHIHPNPSKDKFRINFTLLEKSQVKINIHDNNGRYILTLTDNSEWPKGENTFEWDGKDLQGNPVPSGIYIIQLHTPSVIKTGKAVLIR